MRYIFIILITIMSSQINALSFESDQCKAYTASWSQEQKNVVSFAYEQGVIHNMGLSLAAMAIVESSAGMFNVNWSDPSFSMFHISLNTAISRRPEYSTGNKKHDQAVINRIRKQKTEAIPESIIEEGIFRLKRKLLEDDIFASTLAIEELTFWLKYHEMSDHGPPASVWTRAWGSYNAGGRDRWFKYGYNHSNKIYKNVKHLSLCI